MDQYYGEKEMPPQKRAEIEKQLASVRKEKQQLEPLVEAMEARGSGTTSDFRTIQNYYQLLKDEFDLEQQLAGTPSQQWYSLVEKIEREGPENFYQFLFMPLLKFPFVRDYIGPCIYNLLTCMF